jgi:mannose-6-phosphate isomerase-like protein (cupin superfamily)
MESIDAVVERARTSHQRYLEFLRVPSFSAGVYILPAGAIDRQSPHTEDEVYYVARGRGRFQHGSRDDAVSAGDVLFVPAREPHHFHTVEEELVLLVLFAPPESRAP